MLKISSRVGIDLESEADFSTFFAVTESSSDGRYNAMQ